MCYLKYQALLAFSLFSLYGFSQSGKIISLTYEGKILSYDLATQLDSVVLDLFPIQGEFVAPNWEAASDPFNGRYFLGAASDSVSWWSLRIFTYDLNSGMLSVGNPLTFQDIFYDPFHNRLVYQDMGYLKSYALSDETVTTIATLPPAAGDPGGRYEAYDFVNQRYVYQIFDNSDSTHAVIIDLTSGAVLSNVVLDAPVHMLVYDHVTEKYYGIKGLGHVVSFDPWTGTTLPIVDISDWGGMLNREIPVFDYEGGYYLIPYISDESSIAVVDVTNNQLVSSSAYPTSDLNQFFGTVIPPLSRTGNVITTIYGEAYQWFIDGAEAVNQTEQQITATSPGLYSVQVTCADGRTLLSREMDLTNLGLTEVVGTLAPLQAYPNPMQETASIDLSGLKGETFMLTVYAVTGEQIMQFVTSEKKAVIQRQSLPTGLFFFTIDSENGQAGTGKLVVE